MTAVSLIPGCYEHVTLYGKRDFVGVIELRPLTGETILYYPSGPNLITNDMGPCPGCVTAEAWSQRCHTGFEEEQRRS